MKKTSLNKTFNSTKIKRLYLDACRSYSIKPKKKNFNSFVQFLEGDFHYWTNANIKYFFESMNH